MAQPAKSSAPKSAAAAATSASVSAAKPAPTAPAAASPAKPAAKPTAAERSKMIAEAAYYIAQKRGFAPGNPVNDWLMAEKLVDDQLRKR